MAPNFLGAFGSHFLLPFEVGRQHPVLCVFSLWIKDRFDAIEYILPGLGPGFIGAAPYPFTLEQVEEALRDRVVVTVAAPAHGMLQIVRPEE